MTKPFMSFLGLQSAIAEVDVNLSPLQSSPFTFSKSELKFFEAAVVGTITIASPTPVFSNAIQPGSTGFLAGASSWQQQLEAVNKLDPDARERIIQSARQSALEGFTAGGVTKNLEQLFTPAN
jgi:glycosyltransferase involved in cell wall biosynthesis